MFVNITWIFFRAKTLDDALRVLSGMIDFKSATGQHIASLSTHELAWGGWLSDILIRYLPVGSIGLIPTYIAIMLAFVLISRKNSMEMANGIIGKGRTLYGAALFSIAMCFSLAATSTVFLYFNF